jgi:fumarylacetoacetate (FAA) hydrolase
MPVPRGGRALHKPKRSSYTDSDGQSMKLATLRDGSLDGKLMVVSRDLKLAAMATDIVPSLREAVEQWAAVLPALGERADALEAGRAAAAFAFDARKVDAPLPRAPQWLDSSSFLSHGRRMVKAFKLSNASLEVNHPLMYQGTSDAFLGAQEDMVLPSEDHGIDIEAEVGVITDFVPMNTGSVDAIAKILLIVLLDDVSLRRLLFGEMSLGFGMIQSKPTCVFSPVAVTPDELGDSWRDGRVHTRMKVALNGKEIGNLDCGEMSFSFGEIIAHACRTRTLAAGTIIGSGTISNHDASAGVACIAERRALETLEHGAAQTEFLRFGDRVRIEMQDGEGMSVFGAIDHSFVPLKP